MKRKNIKAIFSIFCISAAISFNLAAEENASAMKAPRTHEAKANTTTEESFDHIVKLLPEDFRPAFTRDTVIKLNAIVKRSYAVINEFDALTRELEQTKASSQANDQAFKAVCKQQLAVVSEMEQRSKVALADISKVAEALRTGDEYYNAAVLAGMVKFVTRVEKEISNQLVFLSEVAEQA